MGEATLRVAALGDIHVKEGQAQPYADLFAEISGAADVLALCGDLTDLGKPGEAHALADSLRRACTVPVVAVLGNHDHESNQADEVRGILRAAGVRLVEGECHEFGGVSFAGAKGFGGGFGRLMLNGFGEPAIKHFVAEALQETICLENALRRARSERIVVVLHYAPVAATVAGEPREIWPYLGCSRLAETVDRFPGARAVLHGHAHRGPYDGRTPGGAPVYNVAYPIPKPTGRPYALIDV